MEVWGWWRPHHDCFSLHAHSSKDLSGMFCSAGRFFIFYENYFTISRKWAVRNSTYILVILTPSMIPVQNKDSSPSLLTSQPCWDISELCPSAPSREARQSSVNTTVGKSSFMCFWAHCDRSSLWASVQGGWNTAVCTSASLWRIQRWGTSSF